MKYEQFYSNLDGQYHMIEELEDENFKKYRKDIFSVLFVKKQNWSIIMEKRDIFPQMDN